jgi:hypothetical protein
MQARIGMQFALSLAMSGPLWAAASPAHAPLPSASPSAPIPNPTLPPGVLWSTQDSFDAPSSAYYDPESRYVYVSNVAGAPDKRDGNGWISRVALSGKVVNARWCEGLHAPKGLRSLRDRLWVADIDHVVEIDLKSGHVNARRALPGARYLSDVAVGPDGTLYVSDPVLGAIFRVGPGGAPVSILLQGPEAEGPNSLALDGDSLIVAAWGVPEADFSTRVPGRLYKIDLKNQRKTALTRNPIGNLAGLEVERPGVYLVSDWAKGIVYRITAHGAVTPILSGFRNAADLGYAADRGLLFVPEAGANQVSAHAVAQPTTR